jgi:polysaccharide biosynthesis protein PelA
MFKLHNALLFSCSIMAFACRESPGPVHVNPRAALASVERFGVQFSGDYHLGEMGPYQLMIIDPDQSRAHEADSLSNRGALAVAYVNIGEAESYRWFYNDIRHDWILGANPNWKDHFYIDAAKQGWHTLVIDRVLPAIFSKGFKGVFLDMVDVASPDLYPMLRPGIVALIHEIREAYPDKILMINNGSFLVPEVSDCVDGMVVESVFASYDFAAKSYVPVKKEDSNARCAELRTLMTTYGMKIFAIDYAPPGDTLTRAFAEREAIHHGFLSFVSTIELNSLPQSMR